MKKMVRTIVVLSLLTLPAGFLYAGTSPSKAQPATNAKAKPDVDHGSARLMSQGNASSAPLLKELGRGPLRFEANAGQFASEAKFVSRGMSHTLFLAPNEAVLELPGRPIAAQGLERFSRLAPQFQHSEGAVARLRLVGANASPEMAGMDLLPGKSNYLVGKDPKQWRTGIAQYARVRYKDVYPGIDWVYYGNEGQLEYDLVVAPGADPDRITLAMEFTRGTNTEALRLDENGDLLLATDEDTIRFHRPRVYQEIDGQKQFIAASYELRPQGQVGFKLGSYDHSQTLVIDPFLSFSTYVGGTATDQGYGVATDNLGNVYVTGLTNSADFPTVPTDTLTDSGANCGTVNCPDVFVMKMDGTGALVYSTYIGGAGADVGSAIAVDTNGNAYITGHTDSTNFPLSANPFQSAAGGGTCKSGGSSVACNDAFVVQLDPTGSNLLYSSYLGSQNGEDRGTWIALVPNSTKFYVVGYTSVPFACNFPVTSGAFQTSSNKQACTAAGAGADGFLAEFDPTKSGASSRLYSTYLSGAGDDFAYAVSVDSQGNAYVGGLTESADFPTTGNAFQTSHLSPLEDAFLAKLHPGGAGAADLLYSTYIGGSGVFNEALGVAGLTGSTSVVFVTGVTDTAGLATSGAPQTQLNNTSTTPTCGTSPNTYTCVDGFLMKFDITKTGSAQKTYFTYIGGSGDDILTSIALDNAGNAFVAGYINSTNLPTVQPVQAANAGGYDTLIARIDAGGTRQYATYMGGSDTDVANGIAVDTTTGQTYSGNVYVAGYTYSTDYPVTAGAPQTTNAGAPDAFVTVLGTVEDFLLTASAGQPATISPGGTQQFTITLTPVGARFDNAISFACSGLPALSRCSFSPTSVKPGSSATTTTLSIQTNTTALAPPMAHRGPAAPGTRVWSGMPRLLALLLLFLMMGFAPSRRRALAVLAAGLLVVATWAACGGGGGGGGGGGPPPPSTPTGDFNVTVTASSGSLSHTVTVVLSVH
jgi:hypothetical protein